MGDVATPEQSPFGETRFEGLLSVGGDDALCPSADLLPKQRPPLVSLLPDVMIKMFVSNHRKIGIGIPHLLILRSILD